jgi:murein DD-endopeptidase MepM/ murein hydrolase activator NlpD
MVVDTLKDLYKPLFTAPIDSSVKAKDYIPIDLSVTNEELTGLDMSNPFEMEKFIKNYLLDKGGRVAYGGYKETRNLYKSSSLFQKAAQAPRNIHLGLDFWAEAGTRVIAPLEGVIHSFKDNKTTGDYGPTIVLKHKIADIEFFTLYGHLSRSSLANVYPGQIIDAGAIIGTLGSPFENVNYAPHLHFQCIIDLEGREGDYPGVCSKNNLDFYTKNCPDPILLIALT